MGARRRVLLFLTVVGVLIFACAPPPSGIGQGGSGASQTAAEAQRRASSKRIIIATTSEPASLYYALIASPIRGNTGSIQELVNPGMVVFDNQGLLQPVAAEAVPTIENGLWKLLPDGRMELTWQFKPGALWQDGQPMTADDLSFTLAVVQDRELAVFRHKYSDLVEAVEAPDPRTVTVRWKQPLIQADWLFSHTLALPMPRHLLERAYAENKATFPELPFWSQDFVGNGPFRLREWVRGSHLTLEASDRYVYGRPKLDEIEVRFIADGNTLISNLLAGSVDLVMRQGLSTDQALQMRDQWRDGAVHIAPDGWVVSYPQFLNANPPIVTNLQFRRAMLHAVDRQQLADTLMAGLAPVAHSILHPDSPEGKAVEGQIVKYDYDVRRATELLEGLGFRKNPDGIFRDAAGQPLSLEARTTAQRDIHAKTLLPVVDYWQRLGLMVETTVWPAQRATDLELQWTFPSFVMLRQPGGLDRMVQIHSAEAPLPERNFLGGNNGRYLNPELDALIDRYLVTIPMAERMQVAGQVVHHQTDQVVMLGMFYDTTPSLVHNRLQGFTLLTGSDRGRQSWNGHLWDVK
jgi:peptide/nickel transport system substrate-binding protein